MYQKQKNGFMILWFIIIIFECIQYSVCQIITDNQSKNYAFNEAVDNTIELASGAGSVSNVGICMQSLEDLMIRGGISRDATMIRTNLTDAELLRLALLASIALISPWNQNPETGKFMISERGGVLIEAFHPSASESDIMLCVVCSLLAIIVMFHVTHAQTQFVQSGSNVISMNISNPILNGNNPSTGTSTTNTTNNNTTTNTNNNQR